MDILCSLVSLEKSNPLTIRLENDDSIFELEKKICTLFSLKSEEILFITRDGEPFLTGNSPTFNDGDKIFVHKKVSEATTLVRKRDAYVGITITNSIFGSTLIKAVSPLASAHGLLFPGDVLVELNNGSLNGKTHFEVASLIKAIPIGSLVEFLVYRGIQNRKNAERIDAARFFEASKKQHSLGRLLRRESQKDPRLVEKLNEILEEYFGVHDDEICLNFAEVALKSSTCDEFCQKVLNDSFSSAQVPQLPRPILQRMYSAIEKIL